MIYSKHDFYLKNMIIKKDFHPSSLVGLPFLFITNTCNIPRQSIPITEYQFALPYISGVSLIATKFWFRKTLISLVTGRITSNSGGVSLGKVRLFSVVLNMRSAECVQICVVIPNEKQRWPPTWTLEAITIDKYFIDSIHG